MDINRTTLFKKLEQSRTIIFSDFDGTLFSAGARMFITPFYNLQTSKILKQNNIPIVFVTGRPDWSQRAEQQTALLGLPQPDAIIAGAGTIIYYRLPNGKLCIDTTWEKQMTESTITWEHGNKEPWNRKKIEQHIQQLSLIPFSLLPPTQDKHLIRLYVKAIPLKKLQELISHIQSFFFDGIKVITSEKLMQENSLSTFSGYILVLPEKAGKDTAAEYILQNAHSLLHVARRKTNHHTLHATCYTQLHAYLFGDASIDVPMLTLKPTSKHYTIHSFGVNLTPLAQKILEEKLPDNLQLKILNMDGPKEILEVLKNIIPSRKLSPAQNSFARKLINPIEPLLDNILDKKLSPNDISFLGLDMVTKSIDGLYKEKQKKNLFQKSSLLKLYLLGNLTDLLDGIRYRQKNRHCEEENNPVNQLPGQLVDVFCDRVKEFYQLYIRAQKRFTQNQELGYQTLLAAISCILPSIARAQAEIAGAVVPEQDPKGGSMSSRTRKLFLSFVFEILNLHNQSFAIDKKIYETNIATFHNRISHIPSSGGWVTAQNQPTILQQNAQSRFLLLIQLLQEENEIIEKTLQEYPALLEKYHKELKKIINEYLIIDVEKLRKEWKIKPIAGLRSSLKLKI